MKILFFSIIFITAFGSIIPTHAYFEGSPYQQLSEGIAPRDIICNDELVLILKTFQGPSACVSLENAINLFKQGWAKTMESNAFNEVAFNASKEFIFSHLNEKYDIIDETVKVGFKGQRDSLPPHVSVGLSFSATDKDTMDEVNLGFDVGVSQVDLIFGITSRLWDKNWENSEIIEEPFGKILMFDSVELNNAKTKLIQKSSARPDIPLLDALVDEERTVLIAIIKENSSTNTLNQYKGKIIEIVGIIPLEVRFEN